MEEPAANNEVEDKNEDEKGGGFIHLNSVIILFVSNSNSLWTEWWEK